MSWPMPEQSSPIKVLIGYSAFSFDDLSVRLVLKYGPEDAKIGKINEHGTITWEPVASMTDPGVTFSIPEEFGRELLEQLLRHYQGASDMHTVRADLLHERGRVDKMIETISNIAKTFSEG